MTKRFVLLLAAALLTLAVPAHAHGAAEARSIDTRILADDDGFFSYDAGAQAGFAAAGGHDLLTLDVRESWDQEGRPALYFRLTWQTDATEPATDVLSFTAGETRHSFAITATASGIREHGFDAAAGPFDVGDGHPKAFDLIVLYETLGIEVGDTLTNIRVTGQAADGSEGDVMPGTWATTTGDLAPWGGDPTHPPSNEPGSYTTTGPAELIRVDAAPALELQIGAKQAFRLNLTNTIADIEQFVTITFDAPENLTVGMPDGILLAPGETRQINGTVTADGACAGIVYLVLHSDVCAHTLVPLVVAAGDPEPVAPVDEPEGEAHEHAEEPAGASEEDHGHDHEHDEHVHEDEQGAGDLVEESPGVGFALLAIGLVAIALIRRK